MQQHEANNEVGFELNSEKYCLLGCNPEDEAVVFSEMLVNL
jgi:hypothetical protein